MWKRATIVVGLLLVASLLVTGCSDESDEDLPDPKLVLNDLVGSYALFRFVIEYSDGSFFDSNQVSFSGLMEISADGTFSQSITIQENTTVTEGTIEAVTNANAFSADIAIASPTCTHDTYFQKSGTQLFVTWFRGCGTSEDWIYDWERDPNS